MKHLFTACLCLLAVAASAQLNLNFLGSRAYTEELSDIWGYSANGREYALVGQYSGLSIVDVTDPTNPVQVKYLNLPGSSIWWDIKVWGTRAYVTNEGSGGMAIVDLSNLPTNATFTSWTNGGTLSTAHNIFIDENGIGYIVGANIANGGAIMIDIAANPTNPPVVGSYTRRYVHDIFVRGDTMWTAEVDDSEFSVVDISNKSNPVVLASHPTTSATTHNLWLSDDGNYLFTTDEVADAYIESYDVSDLQNITLLDRFQSNPGQNVIPHNVFMKGNFGVISYYRDGIVVFDATFPDNMIEVGHYDTSPSYSGNGFNGAWGVYPYLPSGNIIASDIEEGLFILGPTYQQACFLKGVIKDSTTNNPINGAQISIIASGVATSSNSNGSYSTGILNPGSYNVLVSKAGYQPRLIPGVSLVRGIQRTLDVKLLQSAANLNISVQVVDSATAQPLPFAKVFIQGFSTLTNGVTLTADANGMASYTTQPDYFSIYAGRWEHITKGYTGIPTGATITLALPAGYYDDFLFDFNWTETSTASSGDWERDKPIGTDYDGDASNPGLDITTDYGDLAYVTGNGGGQAGNDDIDDGTVTLFSPKMDLTTYNDPLLKLSRWFYNDGGSGNPNDNMVIRISNGQGSPVTLETVSSTANSWTFREFRLADFITITDSMRLIVESSDFNPGHLVEAAIDGFFVIDSITPPMPPVAGFTASDIQVCPGTSVTFSDTSLNNPSSWAWTFAGGTPNTSQQQNPTINYSAPGTYAVTLIATNSLGNDTITLQGLVEVLPTPGYQLVVDGPSCHGDTDGSITLNDTSGSSTITTINWSTGANTTAITGLAPGTYDVTITSNLGCTTIDQATITDPAVISSVGHTTPEISNGALGSAVIQASGGTAPYNYNWSNGASTDSVTGLTAGTYTVTITDANGCTGTDSLIVALTTGIDEVPVTPGLEIAPNPFYNSVTITMHGQATETRTLHIYNAAGQLLIQTNMNGGSSFTWGNGAPAGLYLLRLADDNGTILKTHKLLKAD